MQDQIKVYELFKSHFKAEPSEVRADLSRFTLQLIADSEANADLATIKLLSEFTVKFTWYCDEIERMKKAA